MEIIIHLLGIDFGFFLKQNVSGIRTLIHEHNRYSCFAISINQRPVNRRRTSVFGQQGGVDIQTAPWRDIKNILRNNLSKGCQDNHIGRQFFE